MILAIDQGTTSTRSVLVGEDAAPVAFAYREHRQIFPRPGWVEHDPEEIWRNVEITIQEVLAKAGVRASELKGIGIANQGETVMAWDRRTGQPLANAIVWQCDRTRRAVDRLRSDSRLVKRVHRTTGLVLDCYFSASKMRWLYDHVRRCSNLAIGTLDSWLMYKLSEGLDFVTDATTASRTLLMDLRTQQWDAEMLETFRIDPGWLARITHSGGALGNARLDGVEVPILASAVDQQAALYGQCCFDAGAAKCTFGTGAFLLMHTGETPVYSRHQILTTLASHSARGTTYALDGGVYVAGAAVNWLRDSMGLVASGEEAAALAASVPDSAGVTFVPALAGLAAPYWDRRARGAMFGLTGSATKAHIVRAMFEGIAMRVATVTETMARDSGQALRGPLRVDGGLSQNTFLLRFLADMVEMEVVAPECHETTALGAAYMAGVEAGLWTEAELGRRWRVAARYQPAMSEATRREHMSRHGKAIRQIREWGDA